MPIETFGLEPVELTGIMEGVV